MSYGGERDGRESAASQMYERTSKLKTKPTYQKTTPKKKKNNPSAAKGSASRLTRRTLRQITKRKRGRIDRLEEEQKVTRENLTGECRNSVEEMESNNTKKKHRKTKVQ